MFKGKMPPPSVAAAWRSYRATVLPSEAGPVQVEETEMAFWAGAATLFLVITRMLDPGTDDATPADEAKMEAISDELDKFMETFDARVIASRLRPS